ncbi:hypothetical protein H1C71_040462, partial [Ictidomys tridecemlineatus]
RIQRKCQRTGNRAHCHQIYRTPFHLLPSPPPTLTSVPGPHAPLPHQVRPPGWTSLPDLGQTHALSEVGADLFFAEGHPWPESRQPLSIIPLQNLFPERSDSALPEYCLSW